MPVTSYILVVRSRYCPSYSNCFKSSPCIVGETTRFLLQMRRNVTSVQHQGIKLVLINHSIMVVNAKRFLQRSTWPVILIPYNLPPGMCMQRSNFMLYLLIDGPRRGRSYYFRGLRRFLDENHKFRDDFRLFDGNVEYGQRPTRLYGDDLLNEVNGVITEYGKVTKKKKCRVLSSRQHN
ncbi:hypothetical protein ACJIZ3_008689 [Penstemon smallii]|uniref:Uncharacterized protein n=1 Tax=Penstemon smallii TaxID=265156 RepID=A0ABD3TC25_9LAMI